MAQKYFEDIIEGYKVTTKSREITQEMIDDFARVTGDVNPIHVSEEHVSDSLFGRTIAKGKRIAHGELTSAVAMGLLNDYDLLEGMGLYSITKKYLRPVWPGDSIYIVFTVVGKEAMERVNAFGILVCEMEVFNQEDKEIVQMQVRILAERRNPS